MPLFPGLAPWEVAVIKPEDHLSALEVLAKNGPDWLLKGKTCLVTGGSSGLGVETVRALASRGARVFVLVRQVEKTQNVLDTISLEFPDHGGLEIIKCELDSLESVNSAANELIKRSNQLNILINNAGVMNCPYVLTRDGFETQLGVNHVAHFLLLKKLLPLLLASSTPEFQSRVVSLSSSVHLWGPVDFSDINFTDGRQYTGFGAYAQSKTANIHFANQIEKLYGSKGLHALSVHPGGIRTELQRTTPREDSIKLGMFTPEGEYIMNFEWKSPEQGAATSIWAAASKELEGKGGLYLEDVTISQPNVAGTNSGYAAWAFDETEAAKLWDWSEQAVSKFIKE